VSGPDSPRIASLRRMLERAPTDPRPRFGLALEYEKHGAWPEVVEQLRAYLELTDDEGNAWGRLAHALQRLGRTAEARDALRRGIDAAMRHAHPSMAAAFEAELEALD
jgi:uncharacterized protein HemY